MCDIFCRQDKLYTSARIHDLRYYRRIERQWFTVKIVVSLLVTIACITAVGACFYYYPNEWTYLFWFGSAAALASLIVLWICFCLINRRINLSTVHHMRTRVTVTPPNEDQEDEDFADVPISPEEATQAKDIANRINGALASCTYASGVPVVDTKPIMGAASAPVLTSARIDISKSRASTSLKDNNSYEDLTVVEG
jgi:hypothetical protein